MSSNPTSETDKKAHELWLVIKGIKRKMWAKR